MKTLKPWTLNVVTLALVGLLFLTQGAGANREAESAGLLASSQTVISYQGTLTDPGGNPIDATLPMEFALYDDATDGNLLWGPETQSVQVSEGLFHVLLGSVDPLRLSNRVDDLYLDIKINGEGMSPRELLGSVASAIQAGTVSLLWHPSYDNRGSRTALPGFSDTLYYATKRGITVQANRNPVSGSPDNMFNLNRQSYAQWNGVSETNPVVITISYPGDLYLNGALIAFGYRNSQAIDYTIEYYEDNDDDDTYFWTTIADNAGNIAYEVYHPVTSWRVRKIRITVTEAGDSGMAGTLRIATIEAPSSIHGKSTGHMLAVGGDKMYGELDMNGNNIQLGGGARIWTNSSDNVRLYTPNGAAFEFTNNRFIPWRSIDMKGNTVSNCGALTEANLQTAEELTAERIDRFEEGDVLCWTGERLEKCDTADDPLVQAVADVDGRPIVIGAEVVKVLGPVHYGDLLVASDVPGYAMVNSDPRAGAVIAQALEDFDGERGIIKAMIRKF